MIVGALLRWSCVHPASDLSDAPSAYVRRHAADRVPWRTWDDAAFAVARQTDRPLFVVVGFASCHWCHVLQHESFTDPEIARLIGTSYVPVLVDREERPEVDQVLIAAQRALGRSPGWPALFVLTPDGDIVFTSGYLPPRDGERGVGLLTVLARLRDGWTEDRERLRADAAANTALVQAPAARPPTDVLAAWEARYDPEHGGFGVQAKFPNPAALRLILDVAVIHGDETWLARATRTARSMADGALWDAVGGGFHRYTTDAAWTRPHFEKVAVDNALLATWYADLAAVTGDPRWSEVAAETVRALAAFRIDGGYGNALDASSPGPGGTPTEGGFYTWTAPEVAALGPTAVVSPFEDRLIVRPAPADRARFAAARAARPPLRIDDLWLASTNAQVVRALVRGGRLTEALALAQEIARRPRRDLLDDYAPVALAWLDLLEATADPQWLTAAIAEMEAIEVRFADPAGAWFRASEEGLYVRPRDSVDPSATADALAACLRLSLLTTDPRWAARLDRALSALPPTPAMPLVADVAELRRYGPQQVVVAWPAGADPSAWRALARQTYGPDRIWLMGTNSELAALGLPLLDGKHADRPTAWVCRAGVCDPPLVDPSALRAALGP